MKLRDLFNPDAVMEQSARDVTVTGLAVDSRAVKPGDLFFALAGAKTDGSRFIAQALASGAVAVAGDHKPDDLSVPFVRTPNPRLALALAAAKFYPRQPAVIAAVTGTSGKTSVASFAREIWGRLGYASASIGTIGLVSPKRTVYGSLTTPDPISLHQQIDEITGEGVTHLALEASSHGLDQFRLDGVRVKLPPASPICRAITWTTIRTSRTISVPSCGLFLNLVVDGGVAVIAADHEHSPQVIHAAQSRHLRLMKVGRKGDGVGEGIRLVDATVEGFAQKLTLEHRGKTIAIKLPLVGEFQIENALVAAGLVIGTGGDVDATFAALEHLQGAKGRLEQVGEHNGAPVFVDYAHKPDALAKALQALRPMRSASSSWCSAAAATATRQAAADGRDRGRECRYRDRHR
jgi:UDP-N-acetylmuramoyl-L-alanyl-D-glutamate--2,6-diaminopimelate ligase